MVFMKNIILQHWHGTKKFWVAKCENSIRKYAKDIGADYELLSGFPMGEWFPNFDTKPWLVVQKLFILNKKYDEYDNVLLLDMDMLYTGVIDDIFKYEGVGRLHKKGMTEANASKNGRKWPKLYNQGEPMFFGNCLKFSREERINLREHLKDDIIHKSISDDGLPPNDEIIMHHLIVKSGALKDKNELQLPHDRFCDLPEEAAHNATLLHYCGNRKNQL